LEALCKSDCEDHGHDANGRGGDSKPDDKPGKGMFTAKGNPPGYVPGKIQ